MHYTPKITVNHLALKQPVAMHNANSGVRLHSGCYENPSFLTIMITRIQNLEISEQFSKTYPQLSDLRDQCA